MPGQAARMAEFGCAEALDIRSSVSGAVFRIRIWSPPGDAPATGRPALYAFDAAECFDLLVGHAARIAGAGGAGTVLPLVVAVGYPDGARRLDRRIYDLTPPRAVYRLPDRPNGEPWPPLGGGDELLDTIERDVKPLVAARRPIAQGRDTLFGHSLGGLLTLHALLSRPDAFRAYVASSPSLWFDGGSLVAAFARFLREARPPAEPVPLRLTVGSEEETVMERDVRRGMDREVRRAWVEGNRMIGNARDLARLIRSGGTAHVRLDYEELAGLDHITVLPAAASAALRVAAAAPPV
ncbi:alpha/beta hydrolase [Propylenella binzhouense]|uniref:Alpha/beta hydrolase n=1 Tax=Propylenella binzhouense TaxID=2555902 RepID=A0A964T1Z1_9HYPH|nr:alpha/beta hydrolase-fold protein [Propylenella binzhouense]MYZ46780.1 alpha/beta hydrolase [Propylenella binzhouense]